MILQCCLVLRNLLGIRAQHPHITRYGDVLHFPLVGFDIEDARESRRFSCRAQIPGELRIRTGWMYLERIDPELIPAHRSDSIVEKRNQSSTLRVFLFTQEPIRLVNAIVRPVRWYFRANNIAKSS